MDREKIIKNLLEAGKRLADAPPEKIITFTDNNEADALLNNLNEYPHAFVLACIMDRQVRAERAWLIPYEFSKELGGFEFSRLLELKQEKVTRIFQNKKLHRFNDVMAKNFYAGIRRIHENYQDDASKIWENNPPSAAIVRSFLEFDGVGVKIATMAANILAREFKMPMKDRICIDISPDVQVKKVFIRLGLLSKEASNEQLIYLCRELNPQYPGIFDLPAWKIGRQWCKPKNPECQNCYLNEYCQKNLRS